MRLVELNESELAFCANVAKERERFAVGWFIEKGITHQFKGNPVVVGTPEGEKLIAEEEEIHRQGVTGELAFCKHFDIYFPNRMRRAVYKYSTDDIEWVGDPKDADVSDDIEVRSIGLGVGCINVKERDNPKFYVVGMRRLVANSSRFRILGYFPIGEAQQREDWKAIAPYSGYMVPIEMLRPIELLPFEGKTLADYESERRSAWFSSTGGSPYLSSQYVHCGLDNCDVRFND